MSSKKETTVNPTSSALMQKDAFRPYK